MKNIGRDKRPPIPAPELSETVAAVAEALRDLVEFSERPIPLVAFPLSFGREAAPHVRAEILVDRPETILIGGEEFVLPEARKAWLARRTVKRSELAS